MTTWVATDKEQRLFLMGGMFIAIDQRVVNLRDLLEMRPGSVVRCEGSPADAIMVVPMDNDAIGCVAGWISEDDQ